MDLYDDPNFRRFRQSVQDELIPKLKDSAISLSLVPEEVDVKFAVELGLSIMLDKPIIAVIKPGMKVPAKLGKVVDRWVEGDVTTAEGRAKLADAINAQLAEM